MTTIVSGLDSPTAVDVAANGAIFVTEKRGKVLRYDGLTDTTPVVVADRRTPTHNNRDRGMTGLAVHPQYPAVPWVYVAYSLDRLPSGGAIPAYGTAGADSDPCPDADTTGCPALSRVVRFNGTTANATEQVLFEGHCQQFAYHSVGDLVFESADSLLVSFGDGSTGSFVEYGQRGNLCVDPPSPAGTNLTAPTTEGGQARSQDVLTRTDPTGVHGSVLRVDPNTFAPKAQNPLAGDPEPTVASMVGTGFRNPFRVTRDSSNGRIYVGNVGGAGSEEINLVEGSGLFNSGWPCYEGTGLTQNSFWLTTNICNTLINSGEHDAPLFRYGRNLPIVASEACPNGGLSISGVAVNRVGFGPAGLDGALFFTDYTRDCVWYLPQGANGRPNATAPAVFATGVGGLVDLSFGPDGALWAVDIIGSRVVRFTEEAGNRTPTASFTATPSQGAPPLSVAFDASTATDPDGDPLTYQWDFDGNGAFDTTGLTATHTYSTAGTFQARLVVTDPAGLTGTTTRTIQVGTSGVTITVVEPADGRTFRVGAIVPLRASAMYVDGAAVAASAFSWELDIVHCVPNAPDACHAHDLTTVSGAAGSFVMPDHEYPSYVQATLTVDPPDALPASTTRRIDYRTVKLTVTTQPTGLSVLVGSAGEQGPFVRPLAMSSTTNASVVTPQTLNGTTYDFVEWRLNGSRWSSSPGTEFVLEADASLAAVFQPSGGAADTIKPSTPTGLNRTATTTGINLSWTGSTDNVAVVGYDIYRSTNGTLGALYTTSSSTAFTDRAVTAGVTYTYAVKAFDAAGNRSSRSNLATVAAIGGAVDTQPPSTPTGLDAIGDGSGITLRWNAATDNVGVVGHDVYRSTNGTLGPLLATSSSLSFIDTAAVPGVTYTYAVKAYDAAGNRSSRSNLESEQR